MRASRRQSYVARRLDSEGEHWLAEGLAGADALLLDVDPYLFAVDGMFAKLASQVAHRYDGEEQRPLAIICAQEEYMPWHVGMLRKRYDVALSVPDDDELIEELSHRFDVSVFAGELPANLGASSQLVLFTESQWRDSDEFLAALERAHQLLTTNGRAFLVLRGSGGQSSPQINFADGSSISLSKLIEDRTFGFFEDWNTTAIALSELGALSDFGAGEFAKRHRDFFGKSARDLLLSRLYEEEFQKAIKDGNDLYAIAFVGTTGVVGVDRD
jgi:hypothetical protein